MPKITQITPAVPSVKNKKRVAAYARVSMETDMLLHSLSAQISYYSSIIQKNPEWEYAGVYADEGITGTSTIHRNEFNRLVADCEAGKIDMVVVKSISRFARDTVDCLNTTRHLKSLGIAVYFEREKINSLSDDGELLLTLLASFAQEESRSISENIKWSTRKRFEKGIPNGHKAPYGYWWDGEMFRIIPEQGEVVRTIYRRYLAGESAYGIAKNLAEKGVKGQMGKPIEQTTVKDILSNISYTGTMALQKHYFTEDHARRRNKGELPMYLVDEMFEPLISEADYEKVLEIRQRRADESRNKDVQFTIFSGRIKCGFCGCGISRRTAGKKKRWVCNTRERKGMDICDCRPISEEELMDAAIQALGDTSLDEKRFKREINKVIIYNDSVDFLFESGRSRKILRQYSGRRGQNAFTNKCWCGICGSKCGRDNWSKGRKVWGCLQPRNICKLKRLDELELKKAARHILGEHFEGRVVQEVDTITIYDERLDFNFKDGTVEIWQRR